MFNSYVKLPEGTVTYHPPSEQNGRYAALATPTNSSSVYQTDNNLAEPWQTSLSHPQILVGK